MAGPLVGELADAENLGLQGAADGAFSRLASGP